MSANIPNEKQFNLHKWLFWSALAFALGEFIDAFSIADPTTGIVFALLVAACAWWFRVRASRVPSIILLILSGFELAAVIFIYPHAPTPPAPWRSAIFIILSALVLIFSVLSLIRPQIIHQR
jgi:peptidoglycan/LPS O-acetylase OafA/YrhL